MAARRVVGRPLPLAGTVFPEKRPLSLLLLLEEPPSRVPPNGALGAARRLQYSYICRAAQASHWSCNTGPIGWLLWQPLIELVGLFVVPCPPFVCCGFQLRPESQLATAASCNQVRSACCSCVKCGPRLSDAGLLWSSGSHKHQRLASEWR